MTLIAKFIGYGTKNLLIAGLILLYSFSVAFPLEMVRTTGRAIIESMESKDEARMQALDEALYLAALKGGAKIDGISAVETNSALSENFVIRPISGIIDYTIIDEGQTDEHYSVTVLAAVGEMENASCKIDSVINLTTYKPLLQVGANSPAWMQTKVKNIYSRLLSELINSPNFNIQRAEDAVLDIDKLKSTDDSFDYEALTEGRTRIKAGNYALRTEIIVLNGTSFKADLIQSSSENLTMSVKSSIFRGEDYKPIFTQLDEIAVLFKQTGASRVVNIMGSPSRDSIVSDLEKLVPTHVEKVKSKLKCQPLTANLRVEGERLVVKIGESNGVRFSSLAVVEKASAQWTLLRVVELGNDYTILETLDKVENLKSLNGLEIKFLQEM